MQIASALAGFTLGRSRHPAQGDGEEEGRRHGHPEGPVPEGLRGARGVPEKKAAKIWDHMEQFAGYGFNKSHSAAYAWLAYQTGYLKANYPAYFMAALLTSERANTDKMVQYIGECREMGIRVLPPDVNQSDMFFTVVPRAAERERAEGAPADGLRGHPLRPGRDQERRGGRGRAVLRVRAGRPVPRPSTTSATGWTRGPSTGGWWRASSRAAASTASTRAAPRSSRPSIAASKAGAKKQRDREAGQSSLFGMLGGGDDAGRARRSERIPDAPAWGEGERLGFEKESLGFFITGHPLERYRAELAQWATCTTGGPGRPRPSCPR